MNKTWYRFILLILVITNGIFIYLHFNNNNSERDFIAYEFHGKNDNWQINNLSAILYSNKKYIGNGTITYTGEDLELAKNITEMSYEATIYINDNEILLFSFDRESKVGVIDLLSNNIAIDSVIGQIDSNLNMLFDESSNVKAEMKIVYKSNGQQYNETIPLQSQLLLSTN